MSISSVFPFLVPIVGTISVFTFLAVVVWAGEKRKEREALYRSQLLTKLVEGSGEDNEAVMRYLREEEARKTAERKDGLVLGGLVTMATGAGLGIFLAFGPGPAERVWPVALIPFLIGVTLFLFGRSLGSRPDPRTTR